MVQAILLQFRHFNITFEQSAKPKTDLYVDVLPLINSRRIELLDNQRLIAQLCSLERRTTRGSGRDVIDHPASGGHDDIANAVAGLASHCLFTNAFDTSYNWVQDPEPTDYQQIQRRRLLAHT